MSHFVVVVTGTDIDEQLKPFNEQDDAYCEFNDCTEEVQEKWRTGSGRDDKLPFKVKYKDIDTFASEYFGYKKQGDAYGYLSNPNAKWDWYQTGGRWSGFFKAKPGADFVVGDGGVFNNEAREGYGDVIVKGDVDFEGMLADAKAEAAKYYDDHYAPMGKVSVNQPEGEVVKITREQYIAEHSKAPYAPFAILHNGEWIERGKMGWFGMTSDEEDMDTWCKQIDAFFASLPDDTLLTAVDCHI